MAEEFQVLEAGEATDLSGQQYLVLRYKREDGTDHLHAMPPQALENWMVENDFDGTPKQALPLMLNGMLDQLTPDGVEGPRVILPKDSNHPVHRIHKNVDRMKVDRRRRETSHDAPEHRSPTPRAPAPVRLDGLGASGDAGDGRPGSRWARYASGQGS